MAQIMSSERHKHYFGHDMADWNASCTVGRDDSALPMESQDLHWEPHTRHQGRADLIRQVEALNVHDTLSVADSLPSLKIPARIAWASVIRSRK